MNMQRKEFSFSGVILFFFFINVLIYAAVNTIPLRWATPEIVSHGFFWSMRSADDWLLATGVHWADFIKPFYVTYVEGQFRLRFFSYLVEMFSFKFWQFFGEVLLRNYTVIILHTVNTILAGLITWRITKNRWAGCLTALLILNAGGALATLIFPFRNAKILVMTLFLLAWWLMLAKEGPFSQTSHRRMAGFWGLMVLAGLTDEVAFFIWPLLVISMVLRDGWAAVKQRRMITGLVVSTLIFGLLALGAYTLSAQIMGSATDTGAYRDALISLSSYLRDPHVYRDLGRAAGQYFLRRNFGYWDVSPLGIAAFLGFGWCVFMMIRYRPATLPARMGGCIAGILLMKAILLPHNAGVHADIMPSDTVFPSLLFFSYYYIYPEVILIGIGLGLFLSGGTQHIHRRKVLFFWITVISISNALHLRTGPQDILMFLGRQVQFIEGKLDRMAQLESWLKKHDQPVYVAFPAGDDPVLKARREDPLVTVYGRFIPIRLLRLIEEGRLIVSYVNFPSFKSSISGFELSLAKVYYDVDHGWLYPLETLKAHVGLEAMTPKVVEAGGDVFEIEAQGKDFSGQKLVFFIKGRADIHWQFGSQVGGDQQTYGHAYQMFQLPYKEHDFSKNMANGMLKVLPRDANYPVSVIGPFVVMDFAEG
jgi:hypothetical protein